MRRKIWRLRLAVSLIALLAVAVPAGLLLRSGGPGPTGCRGTARCFTATVDHVVDGDTLDIGGQRIRLALVNTPESTEPGYAEATAFTGSICPVGSSATVDEDDGQTQGSYGRIIALVRCGDHVLNAELVSSGHAVILRQFCNVSEFRGDPWTGC